MNGNTANFFLAVLVGICGLLWRQNGQLERMTGYVHENHAIGERLESKADTTNTRLSKVELKAAEQKGSIGAISWMARIALAMMTLGVGVAGLVLLKVA